MSEYNKEFCELQHKNLTESWARMEEKVDKILEKLDKFSELVQNHEFRIKILETETTKKEEKKDPKSSLLYKILVPTISAILAACGTYFGFGG